MNCHGFATCSFQINYVWYCLINTRFKVMDEEVLLTTMDVEIVERLNNSNTWWQLKGWFHTFSPNARNRKHNIVRLALSSDRFPQNSMRLAVFDVGFLSFFCLIQITCNLCKIREICIFEKLNNECYLWQLLRFD